MVDRDSLVDEIVVVDDDEDDELDRLLLLLVEVDSDRFRLERFSFFNELKRMSKRCQEEYFLRQCSHPFDDDFRLFGDREERVFFEDLITSHIRFSISNQSKHTIVISMEDRVHILFSVSFLFSNQFSTHFSIFL